MGRSRYKNIESEQKRLSVIYYTIVIVLTAGAFVLKFSDGSVPLCMLLVSEAFFFVPVAVHLSGLYHWLLPKEQRKAFCKHAVFERAFRHILDQNRRIHIRYVIPVYLLYSVLMNLSDIQSMEICNVFYAAIFSLFAVGALFFHQITFDQQAFMMRLMFCERIK
jgi:hypothetical protein